MTEDHGPVPQPCGDGVPCSDDCSHGRAIRELVALDEELGLYDRPAPTREEWREVRREVAEERRLREAAEQVGRVSRGLAERLAEDD